MATPARVKTHALAHISEHVQKTRSDLHTSLKNDMHLNGSVFTHTWERKWELEDARVQLFPDAFSRLPLPSNTHLHTFKSPFWECVCVFSGTPS